MGAETKLKRLWTAQKFMLAARRYALADREFEDRTVAVIGPAESSISYNTRAAVEAHDIVVRFNSAFRLTAEHSESIGHRTDILAHNLSQSGPRSALRINPDALAEHGTRFVLWPTPRAAKLKSFQALARLLDETGAHGTRPAMIPPSRIASLQAHLGGIPPSVGLATVAYLLVTPFRSLYISGFSFFLTPYAQGYNEAVTTKQASKNWAYESKHDFSQEARVFSMLVRHAWAEGRAVWLDPALDALLRQQT